MKTLAIALLIQMISLQTRAEVLPPDKQQAKEWVSLKKAKIPYTAHLFDISHKEIKTYLLDNESDFDEEKIITHSSLAPINLISTGEAKKIAKEHASKRITDFDDNELKKIIHISEPDKANIYSIRLTNFRNNKESSVTQFDMLDSQSILFAYCDNIETKKFKILIFTLNAQKANKTK